jgi:hypothetical protein
MRSLPSARGNNQATHSKSALHPLHPMSTPHLGFGFHFSREIDINAQSRPLGQALRSIVT